MVRIAGGYAVMYAEPLGLRFVSDRIETDIKVSETAALLYVQSHQGFYDGLKSLNASTFGQVDRPLSKRDGKFLGSASWWVNLGLEVTHNSKMVFPLTFWRA